MKYKLRQILKLIAAGVLPLTLCFGSLLVAPLGGPTFLMNDLVLSGALNVLVEFLCPQVTILMLEFLWFPLGGLLKSKEIKCPYLATFLATIIPAGVAIWGWLMPAQAEGSMVYSLFRVSAHDVAVVTGLGLYPGLQPFEGRLCLVLISALIFWLGFTQFPMKKIFQAWHIAAIPACFNSAVLMAQSSAQNMEGSEIAAGIAEMLTLACRIAWPFVILFLIYSVWRTFYPKPVGIGKGRHRNPVGPFFPGMP